MHYILAYIVGLAMVFIGLGLSAQKLMGAPVNLDRCFLAFWFGFAITIGFLQIWHLFYPVTCHVLLMITVLGAIGLYRNYSTLVSMLCGIPNRKLLVAVFCSLL